MAGARVGRAAAVVVAHARVGRAAVVVVARAALVPAAVVPLPAAAAVRIAIVAGAVLAIVAVVPAEAADPVAGARSAADGRPRDPYRLTPRRAHLAQVVVPTRLRSRPGGGRRRERLGTAARWGGGPVRLLVLRSAVVGGRRWLQIRLPSRPNDRAGWIPADRTRMRATTWRVVVSLGRRTVTVRRRGRVVRRFRAVVGSPSTPSPRGLFAISERIPQPSGVLGPWALHLTAHSEVLEDYGGGPGRVAIHGRSGALLADPLGSAASHGCIRLDNRAVSWLARRAIEGTPVRVRR